MKILLKCFIICFKEPIIPADQKRKESHCQRQIAEGPMEEKRAFAQKYIIHLQREGNCWNGTLTSGEEAVPFQGLDSLWSMLHGEAPMWQLWRQALTDPLTKVLNRWGVSEQLAPCCGQQDSALLFLDLDRFKRINDSQGHRAGDIALQLAVKAVRRCLSREDQVGRVGGDEFVVLLRHIESRADVLRRAEEIRLAVAQAAGTSVSIGAAWSECALDYDRLFEMADRALYAAKARGKDQVVFCDEAGKIFP